MFCCFNCSYLCYFAVHSEPTCSKNVRLTWLQILPWCFCLLMMSSQSQTTKASKNSQGFYGSYSQGWMWCILASLWQLSHTLLALYFIFTIAKRCSIAGISLVTEAGLFWSINGLACRKFVTTTTNVREAAWVHQTGEPCCTNANKKHSVWV